MIYLLLSIICNITVAVLFKLAKRYEVDVKQAIVWNYSIAVILTGLFYKPQLSDVSTKGLPVGLYITLGLLLPSLFVIIAASIRHSGIVRTDIAQRLSLLIPIFAAFMLFNEDLSPLKFGGISLGFAAIICSVPWVSKTGTSAQSSGWIYLLIVFLGMGLIDILFKQIAMLKSVPYTTSLFFIYSFAFIISLAILLFLFLTKRSLFSKKNLIAGWILGLANFGNILFYLKAHQAISSKPSLVFSTMNIGVIAVGSLVGLWIFNEKLSWLNKGGILLAIVSILLIAYA
jgi:drug/metabolite transporter (DMT)-like permease